MNWIKISFFLTALLILREAFMENAGILLVGNGADWIAIKNVIFLFLDFFIGAGILYGIFFTSDEGFPKGIMLGLVLLSMVLHAGKAIEFLVTPDIAYCYTAEMFWMNNLKLSCLMIAMGFASVFQYVKPNSSNPTNINIDGI